LEALMAAQDRGVKVDKAVEQALCAIERDGTAALQDRANAMRGMMTDYRTDCDATHLNAILDHFLPPSSSSSSTMLILDSRDKVLRGAELGDQTQTVVKLHFGNAHFVAVFVEIPQLRDSPIIAYIVSSGFGHCYGERGDVGNMHLRNWLHSYFTVPAGNKRASRVGSRDTMEVNMVQYADQRPTRSCGIYATQEIIDFVAMTQQQGARGIRLLDDTNNKNRTPYALALCQVLSRLPDDDEGKRCFEILRSSGALKDFCFS
jgi:hypothetical protein